MKKDEKGWWTDEKGIQTGRNLLVRYSSVHRQLWNGLSSLCLSTLWKLLIQNEEVNGDRKLQLTTCTTDSTVQHVPSPYPNFQTRAKDRVHFSVVCRHQTWRLCALKHLEKIKHFSNGRKNINTCEFNV